MRTRSQARKTYRASAVITEKTGQQFPVDVADHLSSSRDLKAAASLNRATRLQTNTPAYKDTIEDAEMRERGFSEWKTNWARLDGPPDAQANMQAARDAVRALAESYVTAQLRGPATAPLYKSNLAKLYTLLDPLVRKLFVTQQHEDSSFPADGVPHGGLVEMHIQLARRIPASEGVRLKRAVLSILGMPQGWEDLDRIVVGIAPPFGVLRFLESMFGDADRENRMLVR